MADDRGPPGGDRPTKEPVVPRIEVEEETGARSRGELLSAVVEADPAAHYVKDAEGRYLMINAAGARLLGRPPADVVGKVDADLFDPETAARIRSVDLEVMSEAAPRTFEEIGPLGGVQRYHEVTKTPYRDGRSRVIGVIGVARDIAPRKLAQAALREAREFLERLLEHAPTPIYVISRDGRIRVVNRAWEEMFGMPRGDVIGRRVDELSPAEPATRCLARNREVLETAEPRAYEEDFEAVRGRLHLYTMKFPLEDASGVVESMGAISIDVTRLKRAEESLRENRLRMQALFDNALDSIWLIDDAGRFVDANPAVCSLLGYSREEFLQMGIQDVVTERDREAVMELWREILASGRMVGEYTQRARDGSTREVDFRVVARILPGLHLAVNRDVTERKRAEREKADQAGALENAVEGFSRIDAKGFFRSANPAYVAILRCRRDELIGRHWLTTVHPDDREAAQAGYRAMVEVGRSEMEIRGLRADGSSFWKQNVKIRAVDEGGRYAGHYCLMKDITERKEGERERERLLGHMHDLSRRLLEAREAERRHLARELHDEVGQLLTGLKLMMSDGGRPAQARPRLDLAREVVDDLLAKVRGMSFDLRPTALDQFGLLSALLALFDRFAESTGVRVDFKHMGIERRFAPELETTSYRIVQEALTNVARHAGVDAVAVRVWAAADALSVQVEDRGRGFDLEAALAMPRASGLVGIQERVDLMNGRLAIESRPGGGTRITAELPRSEAEGKP